MTWLKWVLTRAVVSMADDIHSLHNSAVVCEASVMSSQQHIELTSTKAVKKEV